ncbi:unnamed protein product, partial [Discosporangium mesarthrocarpum]
KTFSEHLLLIFYAGVEGAGHHMFGGVMRSCVEGGLCYRRCLLSKALFPGMSSSDNMEDYEYALDLLGEGLDELRSYEEGMISREEEEGKQAVIIPLNTYNCDVSGQDQVGEKSFPNFGGADKATQRISMRILAALAEEKGIDLRIVYLQRDPADILR